MTQYWASPPPAQEKAPPQFAQRDARSGRSGFAQLPGAACCSSAKRNLLLTAFASTGGLPAEVLEFVAVVGPDQRPGTLVVGRGKRGSGSDDAGQGQTGEGQSAKLAHWSLHFFSTDGLMPTGQEMA